MDMLTVTMSVAVAEQALNTKLHIYEHSEHTTVRIVRASAHYYLPTKIAGHVTMVGELLQFPSLPAKSLRNLQQQGAGNEMAVAEFQGQFFKKSDLDAFGKACHRDVKV